MKTKPDFVFIGNSPAVDFVNTEIVVRGQLVDLLPTPEALVQWANQANLRLDCSLGKKGLAEALLLRKTLRELFSARIDGQTGLPQALDTVNKYLVRYTTNQTLSIKGNEYILERDQSNLDLAMLLEYLTHAGATLLASPHVDRLRRCDNPDCVLLFVDTSRSQKRRWCSMETCGNRAKVSTHYKKQHS